MSTSALVTRWKNPYLWLTILVLGAAAVPFCTRVHSEWDHIYVRAAADLRAGIDVYRTTYGYTYPPFPMALALPFTELSPLGCRLAWYAVNAACLVWLVTAAWAMSGGKRLRDAASWPLSEHAIFGLGLACGIWYSFHALAHQQTDIVVTALILGGCRFVQTGRSRTGGILVGLAAAMKCTPLLLAPYLLFRRQFLAAGLLVATAVGASLLPDLAHRSPSGTTWLTEWYERFLKPMADRNRVPGMWASDILYNQSLGGTLNRWTQTAWTWHQGGIAFAAAEAPIDPQRLKLILLGIELAFAAVAGLLFCRRFRLQPHESASDAKWAAHEYGLVAILMLLFSPMSSIPHFATLILPGFCLARQAIVRRDRVAAVCVALAAACALLSNKDLQGNSLYSLTLWHGIVMANAIVLFAGLSWTLGRWPAHAPEAASATSLCIAG